MAKETKALMRRRKGWIGFVHDYNKWLASDGYENVEWDKKSRAKSITKDVMGKEIQKW